MNTKELAALLYVLIISVIGFCVMGIDKSKAKHNKWRIPEEILFLVAIMGGSPGVLLGMKVFHHKTKHPKFEIGIPVIIIIQAVIVFAVSGLN